MKNTKHIKGFNEATENLNSVSDDYIINGSGLFHWNSSIKKDVKLKMIEWYNNLSSVEKQYVDDLRHEAAMYEYDSHCGEEL
jgi:glyceraldehyde-3-phosphate dehydrogenase/erythrose-4-phosphate dehydrogenase